jgi:hypothetical protein
VHEQGQSIRRCDVGRGPARLGLERLDHFDIARVELSS